MEQRYPRLHHELSWDIIKYSGNVPPSYMEPMPMPNIIPQLQDRFKAGLDDMAGVNDSMFGQQKREQSVLVCNMLLIKEIWFVVVLQ